MYIYRQIENQACRQFVTENSPAMVLTIVQIGFLPPFKYIGILHNDISVKLQSEPLSKNEIEVAFNIKL